MDPPCVCSTRLLNELPVKIPSAIEPPDQESNLNSPSPGAVQLHQRELPLPPASDGSPGSIDPQTRPLASSGIFVPVSCCRLAKLSLGGCGANPSRRLNGPYFP